MIARILLAATIVTLYAVFTFAILRAHRRKAAATVSIVSGEQSAATVEAPGPPPMLVAFASQTGFAEQLANQTAQALRAANVPTRIRSLADLSVEELSSTERALFVVSTYGEGDPPDTGLPFVHAVMSRTPALSRLAYGVLALGDRTYQNFCGFGKTLDEWLRRQCALPMFDLIEVDNADEAALLHWQRHLGNLTGNTNPVALKKPGSERWRISARKLLNHGSAGHPCFHIELQPPDHVKATWTAGDIAVLTLPETSPREYSIASIPEEGALCILVRQSRRADGTPGIASGWLTAKAAIGSEVELRIRPNRNFHPPEEARPAILIGNGTGIAGLRSILKAREKQGSRNWLIFGERNAAHDALYGDDIERWRASGVLTRTDLVYSRDQARRTYVQHVIEQSASEIRDWVERGATIYVCGSAVGMGAAVDEALAAALGPDALNDLLAQHRYRRDVY